MSSLYEAAEVEVTEFKNQSITRSKRPGWKQTIIIEPSKVLIPKFENNRPGNSTRPEGLDQNVIDTLVVGLRDEPDFHLPLITIRKIKNGIHINGKTYNWELVDGHHRMKALTKIDVKEWVFDVYDLKSDDEWLDSQFKQNIHPNHKKMSTKGIVNYLSVKLNRNPDAYPTIEDLAKVLDEHNINQSQKTSATNTAWKKAGKYSDITIRDSDEIEDFINNIDNYPANTTQYTNRGKMDIRREKLGWSVKEGFETRITQKIIEEFHEFGHRSYILGSTKLPDNSCPTINSKRVKMKNTFNRIKDNMINAVHHHDKTGVWPWDLEAYFPQDNKKGEEVFIKEM